MISAEEEVVIKTSFIQELTERFTQVAIDLQKMCEDIHAQLQMRPMTDDEQETIDDLMIVATAGVYFS